MLVTKHTFYKAWEFASKAHEGQFRKGSGDPYIVHPIDVMLTMFKVKDSTNPYLIGTVSLLHDTVEDCDVTLEQIAKEFGYHVAALVEELTLDKEKYKTIGKTEYLIREMRHMSSYALSIKLSDRLNNCLDMNGMNKDFRRRYQNETKAILKSLKKRKLTSTHKKIIKLIKKAIK